MIVIIDMGMGNLRSIEYKLNKHKIDVIISSDASQIINATKLILPGVGNFEAGIKNLQNRGLIPILNNLVLEDKVPILGICLGMQLFTNHSEEGDIEGLGWIDAQTRKFRFDNNRDLKVPHVGWNKIKIINECSILKNVSTSKRFYFTHSYYVQCNNKEDVIATTEYGSEFVSVLCKENIVGTQFHPEKSHMEGFEIVRLFCSNYAVS